MRWRELIDGTLSVPARGEPPPCPEGYVKISKYQCIPHIKCEFRKAETRVTSCCTSGVYRCLIINELITQLVCKKCGGNKEWISKYRKQSG